MKFEWDDDKAFANIEKHGVSFGEATEVFYDPNALENDDAEHSGGESRFYHHRLFDQAATVRRLRRTT